mmetsp:Transcript_82266/g.145781  ORF Transcript_82266/g.145781 Transcript_82266/m.145781 type:complete len:615 (+) Transcript_82266:81-1925(+)
MVTMGRAGTAIPRSSSTASRSARRQSAPASTLPPRAGAPPPRASAPPRAPEPEPQVWSLPTEEQLHAGHGNVSLCARLRPAGLEYTCLEVKNASTLSLDSCDHEVLYSCDHAFGPEASQEQVYKQAVSPICEGVLHGYNGAVIAYGQTGSGKTHTMIGSPGSRGVAPQAVSEIFKALSKRQCWTVEVTVLEIYNERVRDLLAPSVTVVDVHEACKGAKGISFHCPDATSRKCVAPEEALMALSEGMRRRETARTDMNHHSSRSHLVYTLTVVQGDPEVGATIRGRLHIVDLAGSERLKRSMASEYNGTSTLRQPPLTARSPRDSPRDQRREAGEINKSLSQLALVIQRLTGPKAGGLDLVPYRDSMLTRLLAESFGGSSKTCLIITCSPLVRDREETRCSLEFGKRAKLVENKAEINLEMKHQVTPVMQALIQKELADLHHEKEEMLREREMFIKEREMFMQEREDLRSQLAQSQHLLVEAAADASKRHEYHMSDVRRLEEENEAMRLRLEDSVRQALSAVFSESRQFDDMRRQRAAALEAERDQLAQRWQAKVSTPSIVRDNSHPPGSHSAQCAEDSADCSTVDASVEDSSDAEQFDALPTAFDFSHALPTLH